MDDVMEHLAGPAEGPGPDQEVPGSPVVLRAEAVHKRYGGSVALCGAELQLRAGEVHALIGENGSGKSTLLGVISGQIRPDEGEVDVGAGAEMIPIIGRTSAVAIVTQELSLAPDLSVAENIMMGRHSTRSGPAVSWQGMRREARRTLQTLGVDLDVTMPAGRLRVDQQQLVEIARAIQQDAPVLILDEPTSSLSADAASSLLETIRTLRARGVAIVLVSHRLEELFAVADRFTVLRDGRTISTGARSDYDRDRLVKDMVGHTPEQYEPVESSGREGALALRVEALSVGTLIEDLTFDVQAGEALGIVGLSGSGQTEVLEALFGTRPDAAGFVGSGPSRSPVPATPREAIDRGIALVPNDRKHKGLFMELSPIDNISIAASSRGWRLRRIKRTAEADRSAEWSRRFSIKGLRRGQVSQLSGGNQQKVLLSKWLATNPSVLLLDEPTRGVDVGAKAEIHRIIHETRETGLALVIASSEIDELLLLCDRFLVLFRGRLVGTLTRDEANEARLTHMATEGRR